MTASELLAAVVLQSVQFLAVLAVGLLGLSLLKQISEK